MSYQQVIHGCCGCNQRNNMSIICQLWLLGVLAQQLPCDFAGGRCRWGRRQLIPHMSEVPQQLSLGISLGSQSHRQCIRQVGNIILQQSPNSTANPLIRMCTGNQSMARLLGLPPNCTCFWK